MSTFTARLTAALQRVPADQRDRARARIEAQPDRLAELERVVARRRPARSFAVRAAAAPARSLEDELSAAIKDGRIPASRRGHYRAMAGTQGASAVVRLLAGLAPGIDTATQDALGIPRDDDPWMRSRRRTEPGQIISATAGTIDWER